MTNMVIRMAPTPIDNDELIAWLIEAAVRLRRQAGFSDQSAVTTGVVPVFPDTVPGLRGVEECKPHAAVRRAE